MPVPIARSARLRAALDRLAETAESLRFDLPSPGQEERRGIRDRLSGLVRRYLIPRLGDVSAPLLVVVFGPTGSGKSTLLNSLAGSAVSVAGALRPTTRRAVVWCHRRHADRYHDGSPLAATGPVEIVADDHPLLDRVTVVDTPDIDSHVEEHRRQTEAILAQADAGIYVTTAQRYADAVPWEVLGEMSRRGLPLLVVANRLSRRSGGAVSDLASLLREAGVGGVERTDDIAVVQEQRLRGGDRLPPAAVRRVTAHLERLASRHAEVVDESVRGAIGVALARTRRLAAEVRDQAAEAEALWAAADLAYRQQADEIASHLATGELVRGEVVARWQRIIGVGELAAIVARGLGRLRDMVLPREPVSRGDALQVEAEARDELVDLAVHRTRRAVASAVTAWELDPAGPSLLTPELRRVGAATPDLAGAEVDEWLASLVGLVRDTGKSRFQLARAASIGVNAAATMLLVGVFVSTGGLTGAEVGITAGAAAAQQSILEHLFGGAAARRLAEQARSDLERRMREILAADASRFRAALDEARDPPRVGVELDDVARQVEVEAEAHG